jgi:hypothetical protein
MQKGILNAKRSLHASYMLPTASRNNLIIGCQKRKFSLQFTRERKGDKPLIRASQQNFDLP